MRNAFSRVDRQASILMAVMLTISIICMGAICTSISLESTLDILQSRIMAIDNIVESRLNLNEYTHIYTRDRMDSDEYKYARAILQEIREMGEIRYLYTAARNPEGELVYMIDGLPLNDAGEPESSEDYRYPGDPIEPEIADSVSRALNGEVILPKGITGTGWGAVYIAYFPIHGSDGTVTAALGLEYSAARELRSFVTMVAIAFALGVLLIIIASLIAVKIFHRISNPLYRDISTLDFLTKLKNRNSFETDFDALQKQKSLEHVAICMIDLNDLKKLNDEYGHEEGDHYLESVGRALRHIESDTVSAYRYGGDEFIIMLQDDSALEASLSRLAEGFAKETKHLPVGVSYALGSAVYDPASDHNLTDTKRRADAAMYVNKRAMKAHR